MIRSVMPSALLAACVFAYVSGRALDVERIVSCGCPPVRVHQCR